MLIRALHRVGLFAFAVAATVVFVTVVLWLLVLDAWRWAVFKFNYGWKAKRKVLPWL